VDGHDDFKWQPSIDADHPAFIRTDMKKKSAAALCEWKEKGFTTMLSKNLEEKPCKTTKDELEWVFAAARVPDVLPPVVCGWLVRDGNAQPKMTKNFVYAFIFKTLESSIINTMNIQNISCRTPSTKDAVCTKVMAHHNCTRMHMEKLGLENVLSILRMKKMTMPVPEEGVQAWRLQKTRVQDITTFWNRRNLFHGDIILPSLDESGGFESER
jgi:uncharacterized protein CbrC (UPF0167 family)